MNSLVTVKNGVATTTSLIIAEQFGRKHSHVMRSIEKVISTGYEIVPSAYIDDSGKSNKMYELTERDAYVVMPFVGGKKSVEGQIRLVDAFLALRNMAIEKTPLEKRIDALELELTSIRKTGKYETKPQTARLSRIDENIKQLILEHFDWDSERKNWNNRLSATELLRQILDKEPCQKELNTVKPILVIYDVEIRTVRGKPRFLMPPTVK